jgi:hypothetical protein
VANLQSTFANNAKLRLTYPSYLKLQETTGESVDKQQPVEFEGDVPEPMTSLTIQLSNLQYGQSRDIYLSYGNDTATIRAASETSPPPLITAVLEYQHFTATTHQISAHQDPLSPSSPPLDQAEIAYHQSRSALVAFLATLSPLNPDSEHIPLKHLPADLTSQLTNLAATLPAFSTAPSPGASHTATHPGCSALLIDLAGGPPTPKLTILKTPNPALVWTGQIALALLNPAYYRRWGQHYLPSLAGAHARQVCNSFRDAGPLQYGRDSPLFAACRDRLDAAFDALPAPEPTRGITGIDSPGGRHGYTHGGAARGRSRHGLVPAGTPVSMGRYNNVASGCFAGCMRVLLAGGKEGVEGRWVRVGRLREGMAVVTPRGARRVVGVLRMPVRREEMCLVGSGLGGGLLVTPWHPVSLRSGGEWAFPSELARRSVRYTGAVYSILLERDEDVDAHSIMVGGVWGVTMGHGLVESGEQRDVRAHQFYGDYDKVSRALARLPRKAGGVALGGGLTRDPETGMVNGFSRADRGQVKALSTVQRKAVVCA